MTSVVYAQAFEQPGRLRLDREYHDTLTRSKKKLSSTHLNNPKSCPKRVLDRLRTEGTNFWR